MTWRSKLAPCIAASRAHPSRAATSQPLLRRRLALRATFGSPRALTDAIGADYAALYAHCADDSAHYIGSWFRGPSPGGAMASLLYFMGTFGEHPDLRGSVLMPAQERARELDRAFAFQPTSRTRRRSAQENPRDDDGRHRSRHDRRPRQSNIDDHRWFSVPETRTVRPERATSHRSASSLSATIEK